MTIQDLRAGRWGPGHGHQPWSEQRQPAIPSHRAHSIIWDRQESQDSTARDSGIDTSSCFTSSEDSNRDRDCQPRKVGGTWQPTSDGTRLVGRMVLKKLGHSDWRDSQASSSATLLGLKIVGGKLVNGRYGAIVEKVKAGSVADLAGHLLPGDEVLEWNGRSLQSRSYEEVRDIIAASRQDRTIELVVSRDSDMGRRLGRPDPLLGDTDLSRPSLLQIEDQRAARSRSPPRNLGCRLQVKTWYDRTRLEMIVTVLSAVDLPPRTGGQYRNPYAKLFLLPDRSERSKRRTKTLANTNHPRWNQSFVYAPIKRSELRSRVLEVTVWDYDRFGANEFLGEVTIDLAQSPLDEEAEWHYLTTYKNGLPEHLKHSFLQEGDLPPPNSHFSPTIVASRYSESPVSDFEDGYSLYRDRLEQDGYYHRDRLERGGAPSVRGWRSTSPPGTRRGQESSPPPRRRQEMRDGHRARYESPHYRPNLQSSEDRLGRSYSGSREGHAPPAWYEDRYHSLDNRSRRRDYSRDSRYSGYGGCSESDSEWAEDRDGWSDRRNIPSSGEFYCERGTLPRPRAHSSDMARAGGRSQPRQRSETQSSAFRDDRGTDRGPARGPDRGPGSERGSGVARGPADDKGGEGGQAQANTQDRPVSKQPPVIAEGRAPSQPTNPRPTKLEAQISVPEESQAESNQARAQINRSNSLGANQTRGGDATVREKAVIGEGGVRGQGGGRGQDKGAMNGMPSKKSNSTSQLSAADPSDPDWVAPHQNTVTHVDPHAPLAGLPPGEGRKRRLGLLGAKRTTITVHRSEEIVPAGSAGSGLARLAGSADSEGEGDIIHIPDTCSESWLTSQTRDGQLSEFISGLGPGQLVGRQVLGSPVLGDIQLSLCDKRGNLEVEVIRARGLQSKPGSKVLPAPWVKVYLVSGKKCLAKAKTSAARRTLDPLFQQQLIFHQRYGGCVLQVRAHFL
eukprot:TRINITY_DN7603_c0_g1_i1.p1 TRINITY_DN7603_c0_g1~~TRINITY_DN7603_c0_g1_i1.p1  ORF type:complete len:956 (-),score=223.25 TRINITY_DN7603_c0_g1_i1:635-3502(-)